MRKIIRNTKDEIELRVHNDDGVLAAATDVSATVVNSAGVELENSPFTAVEGDEGIYTVTFAPDDVAILDVYTVTWRYTTDGAAQQLEDEFEVVGGFYFTIAEARAFEREKLANTTTYPTSDIREERDGIEDDIEEACGVAFVRRGRRVTLSGAGTKALRLPHRQPARIISVTLDGTAFTSSELAEIQLDDSGRLVRDTGALWTRGDNNYVIHYEHGYVAPPRRIKRAALILLKHRIAGSNIDDRALSFTDELGTRQFAVPGERRTFGIPEVDAAVARYDETPIGAA